MVAKNIHHTPHLAYSLLSPAPNNASKNVMHINPTKEEVLTKQFLRPSPLPGVLFFDEI